ncbi:hypothetical protein B0J11DRAFT_591860 [Dendryphion nanum]|uniref:ABC transporter domain-containing protein n=1 Tax=Dendryphion nanum TaxID=256645 RepID=A0A9P9DE58_9PLEO|nr:hypothetical protein B0J11DRAFT_591860 [Dendryphion nanum]
MKLLRLQLLALIRKNLLLLCARRSITTFIRAIAIPLVVVLVVGYSKNFFASSAYWGVSAPHTIRTLKQGLAASSGHGAVGFVHNGMRGGSVESVIDSLAMTVVEAGKTAIIMDSTTDLAQQCSSGGRGRSNCYGAIVFHSSPDQGTNISAKGMWNYTIRGDRTADSGSVDIRNDKNGPEVYLLPLQQAVDREIIKRSMSGNASALPEKLQNILYTSQPHKVLTDDRKSNYLSLCIHVFGAIFAFAMIGIVYHMTSYVATERELGMSSLIDTMIPGGSSERARLLRLISTYISFAIIYLPGWIAVGIVLSKVVFPATSHNIPIGYVIISGFAFTSFSLFGASFFKKAQLSGSIMVVIVLVFAILPQVLWEQTKAQVAVFSLIFPSANFTCFISGLAIWESVEKRVVLSDRIPDEEESEWRVRLYLHMVFLVVQIVLYPILAFFVEKLLFSTASSCRKFAVPVNAQAPTVTLTNFSKIYKPQFFSRIFKRRKDVLAVDEMSFNAYPGQILCLLGPNGSGKSTTLNCISGDTKVTSGNITIDPTGGLGYAPQANVIWPELTVEEHIRIFSDLKCIRSINEEVIAELVNSCDLADKLPAKASTLSGGQKRKLQMAMMFAGGSAVCCVDEVSTGLDPISRRRIWEILLAERAYRTIIMTTHFLDEADYLADNIAIMYKGSLKAEGTAATLKNCYGNGYTIKVPRNVDLDIAISGPVEKESSRHQMLFRVATAPLAAEVVSQLERNNIHDYQVSGPTMEELFLKATGDTLITPNEKTSAGQTENEEAHGAPVMINMGEHYDLTDGKPISAFKQWWILFCKRFRILRRRYMPYIVILAFAIAGAGVARLLIASFRKPMTCPADGGMKYDSSYRQDFGDRASSRPKYLFGPSSMFDDQKMETIVKAYSPAYYQQYSRYYQMGYANVTDLKSKFTVVDTLEEFSRQIRESQDGKGDGAGGSRYRNYGYVDIDGGIWLGDTPTVVANAGWASYVSGLFSAMNMMLSNVPISTGFASFAYEQIPPVYDFKPLTFIIYYGLIMACYPAFFALYPTNERISNVRSMQYSNGIRPLPLWLSHLAFDAIFILTIAAVGTGLLSAATPVWFGLGYVFFVLFLYGIVSALVAYLISMFAKSSVTAWFMCALGQVVLFFAYFGGLIGVNSSTTYTTLATTNDALFFGLGIISPVVSLERAMLIGLGQFATLCQSHSANSIYLYGGPILYLILQIIILFTILLWCDSSFILPSFRRRPLPHSPVQSSDSDLPPSLLIHSATKRFSKNLAVSDVSFTVSPSQIFALLGPNGAGKSTLISLIRGDIAPSSPDTQIAIGGHSILTSPVAARSHLGVCPQFDSADVLTVSETLAFYAKIRGVQDPAHNIATVLSACGLEAYTNALAQTLSGGTKRKLSLAVALIGNPSVLVLDEPSSALDASAKRSMWRTLQAVSKGRAVVLTTHSMEEADALADRIGIVSGKMLALGTREEVKARAGDAYHVHLVAKSAPRTSEEELEGIKRFVLTHWEGAKIGRETQGGQVRVEIQTGGKGAKGMMGIIEVLEREKEGLGVEFYSVGRATLDEVFEKVVKGGIAVDGGGEV